MVVNNNKYLLIKKHVKNNFGSNDTLVKMYRIEKNVRKFLLTHYLYRYEEDCNNVFKDIGSYKFRGDTAFFETKFSQKGSDPIPKKQKQVYKFQPSGKLILLVDKIYINNTWLNSKDFFGG